MHLKQINDRFSGTWETKNDLVSMVTYFNLRVGGVIVVMKLGNSNGTKDSSRSKIFPMESRIWWKPYVRFGLGEKAEITSKSYLSTHTISCKPIFTVEANQEAEDRINSKGYVLNIAGDLMRGISKDFILTAYCLTKTEENLSDANKEKPLYAVWKRLSPGNNPGDFYSLKNSRSCLP